MNNIELLKEGIKLYGIEATGEMIERFSIYIDLLVEWNKKMNLTAITDEEGIIIKHFLDSLSCLQTGYDFFRASAIDVGTGAGFPGIPMKIAVPAMELTLLDSLNKRTIFLTELMDRIGLQCKIIHGRAEDFGVKPAYREKYDFAFSRAVANMSVLFEYTLPFVKVGGNLLCLKGPGVFEEIEGSGNAAEILGGSMGKIIPTNVYKSDFTHYIAVVKKVKTCPGKYPRKAGMVEKKPLK
jgi:16S rRNA (guanine(527)-N(7))-methyltransferase GidB